jgi:hypothetical protein
MHNSTPLITTIVGGLVLAFLLGMLANRLRISPLVGIWPQGCSPARSPRFRRRYLTWRRNWRKSALSC